MNLTGAAKRLALLGAIAAVYFVAGKLGLRLAFVHSSATAVWPPTGIALAACLWFGRKAWPAILAGAFLVNVTTAGSVLTSLGIAAGNTLEGVFGAWLAERFAGGRRAFDHGGDVIRFAVLTAGVSTLVSASFGVASLLLGGMARPADAPGIWLTWWLGDAGGDLVVAPLLLLWAANLKVRWSRRVLLEGAALLAAAVAVGEVVFGGRFPAGGNFPLESLCMPLFIWAAFRMGRRAAALVLVVVYVLAVQGTLDGYGPFARTSPNESLLLLQLFICVASLTTLTLAAMVAERRRVEHRLRQLATTDALTGLGNYRALIGALEREIQRSRRTARSFAVLFLDLDGLKRLNDSHGHLVGSRALCRVADALWRSSRVIDTAARYGGDEFALVMPEAEEAAARQVLHRVRELLASSPEQPRVTVSAGVACFPKDGQAPEALLAAADRDQYQAKAKVTQSGGRP